MMRMAKITRRREALGPGYYAPCRAAREPLPSIVRPAERQRPLRSREPPARLCTGRTTVYCPILQM